MTASAIQRRSKLTRMTQVQTTCANLRDGRWAAPLAGMSSPEPKHLPSTIVREDEGALVSLAKSGDVGAFDELVNRYERRIFRLAMNITQNREDAEDATQDAFLKSFQHLPEFQGGSRFYTWLVRIAVNEALMRLRRRRPTTRSYRSRSAIMRRHSTVRHWPSLPLMKT